jgi:hypothetical protein
VVVKMVKSLSAATRWLIMNQEGHPFMMTALKAVGIGVAIELFLASIVISGGLGPCNNGGLTAMLAPVAAGLHFPAIVLARAFDLPNNVTIVLAPILGAGMWSGIAALFLAGSSRRERHAGGQ